MLKTLSITLLSICWICGLVASSYLHLDNQTTASLDDVLDDPLLVMRTKDGGPGESMDWNRSCQRWAEIESQKNFSSPIQELCLFSSFQIKESGSLKVFAQHDLDCTKPQFIMSFQGREPPRYLWWQISNDPEFHTVISNLNVQVPYSEIIRLSDLEETFLNPDQTYYFRVRADHSAWSTTCSFHVQKPARVQGVMFCKIDDRLYELSWQPHPSPSATYLVFASHAFDFVPSIYFDEQLNGLYGKNVWEKEAAQNLICETSQASLLIEGNYPFYRIIACDRGQLAVPSPLIYIYDQELISFRTQLKQDSLDPLLFKRQILPSSYEIENKEIHPFIEKVSAYLYNPLVPKPLWQDLKPYFLPVNHPIKARLDRLFQKNRITQSEETFEKGGFGKPKMRKPGNIVIGRNPHFRDYIFKVYLDTQPLLHEWDNWVKRIEGARAIQACIKRHGFRHFSAPGKWIYPLPEEPSPPSGSPYQRKNFILIAENMNILSFHDNLKVFKNKMSPQLLKELYTILKEEGLIDSVYPDNIPFTKKGQISFIDTEHHHLSPVPFHVLTHFLSPDMQRYWQSLIDTKTSP